MMTLSVKGLKEYGLELDTTRASLWVYAEGLGMSSGDYGVV